MANVTNPETPLEIAKRVLADCGPNPENGADVVALARALIEAEGRRAAFETRILDSCERNGAKRERERIVAAIRKRWPRHHGGLGDVVHAVSVADWIERGYPDD